MSRRALVLLLAAAAGLALVAAWRELSCRACGGGLPLGILGAGFYATAAIAAACFGVSRPLAMALFASTGFHAGLVLLMVLRGSICASCLAVAGISAAASGVVLVSRREFLDLAAAVAPWAASFAFLLPLPPAVPAPEAAEAGGAAVQVTIYSREECPYCGRLRDEVLPAALAGLEQRVQVRWIDAPVPTRVPGIVISRSDRGGGRYIEGLPPADFLRSELEKALGGRP